MDRDTEEATARKDGPPPNGGERDRNYYFTKNKRQLTGGIPFCIIYYLYVESIYLQYIFSSGTKDCGLFFEYFDLTPWSSIYLIRAQHVPGQVGRGARKVEAERRRSEFRGGSY